MSQRHDVLVVNLTYDVPFQYLFAQEGVSEDLLAAFLNDLLDLKDEKRITQLEYRNVEVPPVISAGRRLILDLRVTDQRGVTYNIELQREDQASIIKRALFQQSRITGEQLGEGQKFNDLTSVVIILLCNYSTFPDGLALRVFRLAPFKLDEMDGMSPLPHRRAHFDPERAPRYHQLKRRLETAEEALDLIKIYFVELDKSHATLSADQRAWLRYLTTDFTFSRGDDNMYQLNKQTPQYIVPEDASEETKQWIAQAQERLNLFAGRPEYRAAYEHELLNMIDHNSSLENSYQRGREEGRINALAPAIENLRRAGLDDNTIAHSLQLTPAERETFLTPR